MNQIIFKEIRLYDNTKGYHKLLIQVWNNKSLSEIQDELNERYDFFNIQNKLSLELFYPNTA